MKTVTIRHPVQCKKCGYTWFPRGQSVPLRCANQRCRSPYWQKERKK